METLTLEIRSDKPIELKKIQDLLGVESFRVYLPSEAPRCMRCGKATREINFCYECAK